MQHRATDQTRTAVFQPCGTCSPTELNWHTHKKGLFFFSFFCSCFILFLLLFVKLLPIYSSFRSIYDDQPNAHKRFMEKLDARIRNHDREIEKMCNFHHQGFVDAITELLKVRADAEKLMVREITLKITSDP